MEVFVPMLLQIWTIYVMIIFKQGNAKKFIYIKEPPKLIPEPGEGFKFADWSRIDCDLQDRNRVPNQSFVLPNDYDRR